MTKYEKGTIGYYIELAKEVGYPHDIENSNIGPFLKWARENGKLPDHANVSRKILKNLLNRRGFDNRKEYRDKLAEMQGLQNERDHLDYKAKNRGFENHAEYVKITRWNKGINGPAIENETCPDYLGCEVAEKIIANEILSMIFEIVKKKPYKSPGFDFICKNPRQEFIDKYPQFKLEIYKEYKIDIKSASLESRYDWNGWSFHIGHNNVPDYFLLIGFGKRYEKERDNILHILLFKRDDIVRDIKFWRFNIFVITNKIKYILLFNKYELKDELERLAKS